MKSLLDKIAYPKKSGFQKEAYIIDAKILIAHDEEEPVAALVGKVSGKDNEYFEFGQSHVEKLNSSEWFKNVYLFNKQISVFQAHRAVNTSVQRLGYAEDLIIALANYIRHNEDGFIGLFPTIVSSANAVSTYPKLLQSNRLGVIEVFGLVPKESNISRRITDSHESMYLFTTSVLSNPLPRRAYREPIEMTKKSMERFSGGKLNLSFIKTNNCIVTAGLLIAGGVGAPSIPVETATMQEIHDISIKSKPPPKFFGDEYDYGTPEEVTNREKSFDKFLNRIVQIEKIRGGGQ